MNRDTFCSYPFNSIFLGPDGHVKPCCSAVMSVGDLHTDSIDTIIQSNQLRGIRQSILDGEWNPACRQCQRQEEQGASSERDSDLEKFKDAIGTDIDSSTFKLQRLDLRWSNTCNLNCVYCYEFFSSRWAKINNIDVNSLDENHINGLFRFIEERKDSITTIMLLGGEPLLQKPNERLLNILSGHGIYILTNFSVPLQTNRIAQRLLAEPHIGWGLSFETVGDRFEYVRRGADWKLFLKNIEYYQLNKSKPLNAHSLYSIYSAFNLVEFYEFITTHQFNTVHWSLLESSGESSKANVLNLPGPMKLAAINEIDRCVELFPEASGIDALVSFRNTMSASLNSNVITTDGKIQDAFLTEITSIKNKLGDYKLFSELWPEVNGMLNDR